MWLFFYIPVIVFLTLGAIMFGISLGLLLYRAKKAGRMAQIVLPYLRLLLFVFLYLFIFALYFAETLNREQQQDWERGYKDYFLCLMGLTKVASSDCALLDNKNVATNNSLALVRGFAISSLGLFLFFTITSVDTFKLWITLLWTIMQTIWKRDRMGLIKIGHLLTVAELQLDPATTDCSAVHMDTIVSEVEQDENSNNINFT